MDPRPPRAPEKGDDVVPGLPAIDGADTDTALETAVELDVRDDEASALDDANDAELAGSLDEDLDGEPASVALDDDSAAPLEADPSLAAGENERWTEGSDASEDTPWQEPGIAEPSGSHVDRGEEGFDDLAAPTGDALPGLPAAHAGDTEDEDADELDVSEASSLETPSADAEHLAPLPIAALPTTWRGPPREAARAVAHHHRALLAAARGLWALGDTPAARSIGSEGEISALLTHGDRLWLATDAGDIWTADPGATPRRHARPGTDDGSVGAIDLASIGDVVVGRPPGGALLTTSLL
jgi:hypothetical protein